ncbi:MAG: replication-associated recombination protein A [Burkholderiaceae bacterium]|nr:replication-associated recombination protein A [Burkholderiaceae bacterium]
MPGLFDTKPIAPLAEALRPKQIDEVIGQAHLLGPGKPLRLAFESGQPHSMILWGPPGVGKTTIARLSAQAFRHSFIAISAVLAGVKEIREAIEQAHHDMAQFGRQTILFVDEIHRFNKSQQDALLPHMESGLFTVIGATTENPSFEVNAALLSRAQVYVLKSLTNDELKQLVTRACAHALPTIALSDDAITTIVTYADGDARRLINLVEQLQQTVRTQGITSVDRARIENTLNLNTRRFDKGGDQFYDQISALHKSVRGSHPDAALYWLCRMLDGGADPRYLARRIIRMRGHNSLTGDCININRTSSGLDRCRIGVPINLNTLNVISRLNQSLVAKISQYQSLGGCAQGHQGHNLALIQIDRQGTLARNKGALLTTQLIHNRYLVNHGYRGIGHCNGCL